MQRDAPFPLRERIVEVTGCLDVTHLADDVRAADVAALCATARAPLPGAAVTAAAVCVPVAWVAEARDRLRGSGVRVATVVGGFPGGTVPLSEKLREAEQALAVGADELDLVVDHEALRGGDAARLPREVSAVRALAGHLPLKAILEVNALRDPALVRAAARLALEAGADFLKTSTGRYPGAFSMTLFEVLLDEVVTAAGGRRVGVKASGGVRETALALDIAARVRERLGGVSPERLRIGASALVDELVASYQDAAW